MYFAVIVSALVSISLIVGGIWLAVRGTHALNSKFEHLKKDGKIQHVEKPAPKDFNQQVSDLFGELVASVGGLFFSAIALGIIFIIGIIILAIVKWSFQIVF